MLILNKDGSAKRFFYKGNGMFDGKLFSSNELLKFAIEILTSEYESRGIEVTDINYNIDHSTFNFKINNSINKIGFLVNLNTSQDRPNDFDLNDYSYLIENSIKQNYIPRLATATFWEFEKKGDWGIVEIGKNGTKDGVYPYVVKFDFQSLLTSEENPILDKVNSHNELLLIFAKAWETLDASIIEPYIDKDFHYYSDWVFDELPCRKEYMEYFMGKIETLKRHNLKPTFDIVQSSDGELAIIFDQNGEKALFTIKTLEGRIHQANLTEYNEN